MIDIGGALIDLDNREIIIPGVISGLVLYQNLKNVRRNDEELMKYDSPIKGIHRNIFELGDNWSMSEESASNLRNCSFTGYVSFFSVNEDFDKNGSMIDIKLLMYLSTEYKQIKNMLAVAGIFHPDIAGCYGVVDCREIIELLSDTELLKVKYPDFYI